MAEYPEQIERLSDMFRRLDGIGKKTAMRLAFSVLDMEEEEVRDFAAAMVSAKTDICFCKVCKGISAREICSVCSDGGRDRSVICVVEDYRAAMAVEKVREYRGLYHVLHGCISPMNNIGPDDIRIKELLERVAKEQVDEIIMATNPDTEGEATAMYITRLLKPFNIRITRLAYGIPVGGHLEFADEITLTRALEGRREML